MRKLVIAVFGVLVLSGCNFQSIEPEYTHTVVMPDGDGRLILNTESNLPMKTVVVATLYGGENPYAAAPIKETENDLVVGGTYSTHAITGWFPSVYREGLPPGDYRLNICIPQYQPASTLGEGNCNLSGAGVKALVNGVKEHCSDIFFTLQEALPAHPSVENEKKPSEESSPVQDKKTLSAKPVDSLGWTPLLGLKVADVFLKLATAEKQSPFVIDYDSATVKCNVLCTATQEIDKGTNIMVSFDKKTKAVREVTFFVQTAYEDQEATLDAIIRAGFSLKLLLKLANPKITDEEVGKLQKRVGIVSKDIQNGEKSDVTVKKAKISAAFIKGVYIVNMGAAEK